MTLQALPKHFEAQEAEERWAAEWDSSGIYHYDSTVSRDATFVIDTPPPTVSGSLHIGHVFSYTQTDIVARFQRMRGRNIFYPMGWDDNGLPTERRVQNYYHVRCDPYTPYVPGLAPEIEADAGRKHAEPRRISRANFIELCLKLTAEDEQAFKALWRRVGLSVDWRQEYSTIDDRCRRAAQLSFLDLYDRGHIYNTESPTTWDLDFQTAVAQAEIEDRRLAGHFYHVRFGVEDSPETFVIATTRPELLPACVGVTAHPRDERYKHLFGRRAVTPLFRAPVPIFPSELADPEKGTGVLMVCTFGDATDVSWWREQGLPLRQIVGRDGRLLPVTFGEPGWESRDASAANRIYSELAGANLKHARERIVSALRDAASAAIGAEPPLASEPQPLEHSVKFYEKGERPLEFISTRQWFVCLRDKKEWLLELGNHIEWHPDFMRLRYRTWTENLLFDWAISRQRYFGVPFPVWYRLDENGQRDFARPILAAADMLPLDPMVSVAPGFEESQRDQPSGFTAETDVFDTWFTSSLSPQIASHWQTDPVAHAKLFPMDLRPQSHEIIRTWAFYTIVKSALHENSIPWRHVAISGWVLDPDRKKMSKSRGNVITPIHLLEEYGSDAVRYWSASARLGVDTAFDQNVLKVGRRLVTKIFNAGKFVLTQTAEPGPISSSLDLLFLSGLRNVVERVTTLLERFEHASALAEIEQFFWRSFTDNYLEMVKVRARAEDDLAGRTSAVATLRLALSTLLRLFAPYVPYVTEEVWSWASAANSPHRSVHSAPWPAAGEFPAGATGGEVAFETAAACLAAVHRAKSESHLSAGRAVEQLHLICNARTRQIIEPVARDVLNAARVARYQVTERPDLADGVFEVAGLEFVERLP